MARRSTHKKGSDGELRRLLKRYNCPLPFHAVRTFFLGNMACPKIETRPLQVLEVLWKGELPEFESLDDANDLISSLVNGLWNRLTVHQSRKHPFRLTPLPVPTDREQIRRLAETRVEELESFVNGLFGGEDALNLPESAHDALTKLAEERSFFAGFVQFADDHDSPDSIKETARNMQQLSIIGAKEINEVVLGCTRARRAALETMRATPPTWH
jgi:hypothetical protein